MKKIVLLAIAAATLIPAYSQTCVGTFNLTLFDAKSKKPVSEKIQKEITYAFTIDETQFYDEIQTVIPLDSVLSAKQGYTVKKNEKGYQFFNTAEPSAVMFATRCGEYLVHLNFIGKKDTMSLSLYNIPAHQSFQIDTVMFQKGNFFIDLQASSRLGEFTFVEDKGYFLISSALMQRFPEKEE